MSSSLIKSYSVNYSKTNAEGKKKTRVIDSNLAVSEKIRHLSEKLEQYSDENFVDDFTEGLNADMVDALLTDQEEVAANNEAYEKVIAEANEEASQIILEAQHQATQITDGANSEASIIRDNARKEGHDEGYNEGYQQGVAEAETLKQQVLDEKAALEKEFEAKFDELEPILVDALTDIYSHVFGIDIKDRSGLVLHLLNSTIRNIEGGRSFLIHVSKEDREEVDAGKEMLTDGLGSSSIVEIIEDISLSKGNCFIETDSGIFDCSLGTELELLAKELRLLSYTKD